MSRVGLSYDVKVSCRLVNGLDRSYVASCVLSSSERLIEAKVEEAQDIYCLR